MLAKIAKNGSYLTILQIVNLLVPLMTYPYLVNVFGIEAYGGYIFITSIVGFLSVFINFGFNTTGTKEIAAGNNFINVYLNITLIKILIFLSSLLISVFTIMYLNLNNLELFFVCVMLLLYDLLFPYWYFMGKEKFLVLALNVFISRIAFLFLIFGLLDDSSILVDIPIYNAISLSISLLLAALYVYKEERIIKSTSQIGDLKVHVNIKMYFEESFQIFQAQFVSQIYESTSRLLVGSGAGDSALTLYDLAEKIVKVFKVPINSLGSILFPIAVKSKNIIEMWSITRKVLVIYVFLYLILYLTIAEFIEYLFPREMLMAVGVVEIYSIIVFVIIIKQYLSFQVLIPFGYVEYFKKSAFIGGACYLLSIIFMSAMEEFVVEYIVIAIVVSEMVITTCLLYFCIGLKEIIFENETEYE